MVLEPRTTRDIPVDARFTGVPPGFRIAETSIVPPTVSVVGPRSRVEQLERAETDPIEIQAASGGADYRVQTFVGDPQVRFASSPIVSVRVTLEAAERD
jgi:YbbR domain-containing protein